ncbi:MAG: O-antigen ligase family protein [Clostridia bacterium]
MKNSINKIKYILITKDTILYISVAIVMIGFILNACLFTISKSISINLYNIVDKVLLLIEGGIIFLAMINIFLNSIQSFKKNVIALSIFVITVLFNYMLFVENREILLTFIVKFFIYDVSIFLIVYNIKDKKKLLNNCIKTSKYMFILAFIYLFMDLKSNVYNVWLSQYFFISGIFSLYDACINKKIISNIISLLSLVLLVYTGSRTYLLIYIIVLILTFTFFIIKKIKKLEYRKKIISIFIITIIILLLLLLCIFYKPICKGIYDFFLDYNIDIRILRIISSEDFFTSDARSNIIYSKGIQVIKDNFLFGVGIGADRRIMFEEFKKLSILPINSDPRGYYAHNLIIEILIDFGIIFGTLIIISISYLIYKMCKNKENIGLVVSLICIGILPLMLNGTLYDNMYFWMLIAILISSIKFKKNSLLCRKEL